MEIEFIKRCNERRQDFMVARKRYEFLQTAIKGNGYKERYEEEMRALHDALIDSHGPAMAYNGELNEEWRGKYPELLEKALTNLQVSHLIRPVWAKAGQLGSAIFAVTGGGPTKEDKEMALTAAQDNVVTILNQAFNKSWRKYTTYGWTPTDVKDIEKEMKGDRTTADKLTEARQVAEEAANKASEHRNPGTQIFYDAIADIKLDDVRILEKTASIIQEVVEQLG